MADSELVYYTDGSCIPNPGSGGYAVILNDEPVYLGYEIGETTSNRMEGLALLKALEHAAGAECLIYSDSQLWVNILTVWGKRWKSRGWRKRSRHTEIANLDIVQPAVEAYLNSRATVRWVPGHAGIEGNELAHVWAEKARQEGMLQTEYHRPSYQY